MDQFAHIAAGPFKRSSGIHTSAYEKLYATFFRAEKSACKAYLGDCLGFTRWKKLEKIEIFQFFAVLRQKKS